MKIGIVMDPIQNIKPYKDTTFAMMLAAQARGHELFYMELNDLHISNGIAWARTQTVTVADNKHAWFEFKATSQMMLSDLDVILMRKDPPVDTEYLYATYILERAELQGTLVVNTPQGLRDVNEKLFISWFPQCCTNSTVDRSKERLKAFIKNVGKAVLKPLHGMGGMGIFVVNHGDPNTNVILETLTKNEEAYIIAQQYLPEISAGDKRILMINGEPVPYALARIPAAGETRGNLAAGGRGEGIPLSDRDRWICAQVAPELKKRGLVFVGLDVIGDYLTEVNVTSPTCVRELDTQFGLDIAGDFIACLESMRTQAH